MIRPLRMIAICGLLTYCVQAVAQFEYGVAVGGVLTELHARPNDDPHGSLWVDDVGRSAGSVSIFYRERYSDPVDLGVDVTWVRREFSTGYAYGGLGGGTNKAARAELDLVYIGIKPEVHLDPRRLAAVRFGLMGGFIAGGSARGSTSSWSIQNPGSVQQDADLLRDFGGDFRFAFGFGFRVPLGEHWAIAIDPEATFALSSVLHTDAGGVRGTDVGVRIGLARRSNRKAVSALFKLPPRIPETGEQR